MRALILIGSLLGTLSGCVFSGSPVPPGRPVRTVYEEGTAAPPRKLRIESAPPPGAQEKTRPVIYPPKVYALWVPTHLNPKSDMKIGAHWIYVKLRDSSWTEQPIDREPLCENTCGESDIYALRQRFKGDRFGRVLVPYNPSRARRSSQPAARSRQPFPGDRP